MNNLNDAKCRAAKPGSKARKIFDGGGLYLFVTAKGAKTWRLAYRFNGKQRTKSFGPYPAVSLAKAREHRDAAKELLRDGVDPMQERRTESTITLADATQEYWGGRNDVSEGYRNNAVRGIEMHLFPLLGKHDVATITREDLLGALSRLDAAGKHAYVRKVRMWVSHVFDWAVELGYATINPAALIDARKAFGHTKTVHHAAIELRDMPEFMSRLAFEGELTSALACKLLALTWVRTNEARFMTWSEIEDDTWRIPGERMKMDKPHIVPLSQQARAILRTMEARSRGGEFVFPQERSLARPISENAILYLIYRMGYKDRMTGHGFRTVASTWANEREYREDAIERQLAHTPSDAVRAAYNRAAYLPQRRKMLQAWADWLDSITES